MSEEQSTTGNPPSSDTNRTAELENLLTQKDAELIKATARITEMEQSLGEKEGLLTTLQKSLRDAVGGYRSLILQIHPGISAELITGDTLEAIDKSLEKARGIVGRVRQSVEKEMALARVTVGSPARRQQDTGALSPREKIQYALGDKK